MASGAATKSHPYHMVDPSPWPAVGTVAALSLAIGGIWYMHGGPLWAVAPGFLILFATFYYWWRDVIRESRAGTFHTEAVNHGLRVGFLLFIASEVMFFFAFFWAFFNASSPLFNRVAHTTWPPEGIVPFYAWGLPFLNTLILLTSGATVTVAHHAFRLGDRDKMVFWTGATVVLGIIFLTCQAFEYSHAAFGFKDGIYPSTFFMATGFHGFHVFVGTCFLLVCFLRARAGDFTPQKHVGFEAAAWYWHFVDVVWLFLFVVIYWWGSLGFTGSYHHCRNRQQRTVVPPSSEAEGGLWRSLALGARGRCPRCGRGRLFDGFLTVRPRCDACGLSLVGHDAGDGPAVFGIFILGFGIVGLAGYVEYLFSPPLWLHVVIWTPLIIASGLLLLRPLKGLTIAIQSRVRSTEESERPGAS